MHEASHEVRAALLIALVLLLVGCVPPPAVGSVPAERPFTRTY
jgi:hypothetical protein